MRVFLLSVALLVATVASGQLVFPDGSTQTTAFPTPNNVVYVPATGTDGDNGSDLRDAIAAISDASFGNPYVIQLDPGTYDVGATTLTLKDGVHIKGAHFDSTEIEGSAATILSLTAGYATISDCRLENKTGAQTIFQATGTETEAELLDVIVEIKDGSTGTVTGVAASGGADVVLSRCIIEFDGTRSGSTTLGVSITGTNTSCDVLHSEIDIIEIASATASAIGVRSGSGSEIEIFSSRIEGSNEADGTGRAIDVLSGGEVICTGAEVVSNQTALSNAGGFAGMAVLFFGTIPAENPPTGPGDSTFTLYSQCSLEYADL